MQNVMPSMKEDFGGSSRRGGNYEYSNNSSGAGTGIKAFAP
jgi:hypothetical protein